MTDGSHRERLRRLPAVDRVIQRIDVDAPRSAIVAAARSAVDEARERVRAGAATPSVEDLATDASARLADRSRIRLQQVINATGVLVHTNLGRVPLGSEQLEAITRLASVYTNLEYDIEAGERGTRLTHAGRLLAELTGAEAGLVVNNNAAAVLLAIAALAAGGQVVISRGELVEIGGEFRIPDVMEIAGARLVEVGTTNRTRLADYERAITPDTTAILKVHPSNYRMIGFTETVASKDLARLGRGRGLAFINDLGSGLVAAPGDPSWARGEPRVGDAVAEGADVVSFSGDKLLGGPQAGLIVGRSAALDRLKRHALIRALRIDKMTLAALEVTLDLYLRGRSHELPLWAMAGAPAADIEKRARTLADRLDEHAIEGARFEVVASTAVTGGGSLPGTGIDSFALALQDDDRTPSEIERRLRRGDPPVIALVEGGRVLLDLRTVTPADDEVLVDLVAAALSSPGQAVS